MVQYHISIEINILSFLLSLLQAKSEEQLASEKAFEEAERVWLVHKEGFAAAGLLERTPHLPEGRVRVQLDYNGDIIEVRKLSELLFSRVEPSCFVEKCDESYCCEYGNGLRVDPVNLQSMNGFRSQVIKDES